MLMYCSVFSQNKSFTNEIQTSFNDNLFELSFNTHLYDIFYEITIDVQKCRFYIENCMFFIVSWSIYDENSYYLFITPKYLHKIPVHYHDLNIYGFCEINEMNFLFYGIQDSTFFDSKNSSHPFISTNGSYDDPNNYFTLCDGCFWAKLIEVENFNFYIEAEICKEKPKCNNEK